MDKKYTARLLRKNSTNEELKLWKILRNRNLLNLKFKRQVPIGNYIVDFLCEEKRIIIELDGGQHNETENIVSDRKREEFLKSKNYTVVRFWNNEINENFEGVYEKLLEILQGSG